MKRRSFFGAAWVGSLSALGLRRRPARVTWTERPWSDRAAELFEREGHWCDLAAWEEWMADHWPDFAEHTDVQEALGGLDEVALYCCFCDAIDGATVREDPSRP